MILNEQLKKLRKVLNITQFAMAKELEISITSYKYYESGERSVPSDIIEKILKIYSVNSSWLFENTGNMFKDSVEFEIENLTSHPKWGKVKANIGKRIIDAYNIAGKKYEFELLQNWLSQADINEIIAGIKIPNNMILEGVLRDTGVPKAFLEGYAPHPQLSSTSQNLEDDFIHVPLHDDIFAVAEIGNANRDNKTTQQFAFQRDWLEKMRFNCTHLSLAYIEGNSMSPTLQNGDIVLIDHSQTEIRPDRIVVVATKNMAYFKRIQSMADGKLTLKSDNPEYPPLIMDLSDAANRIVGRIIWFTRCI